MEQNKPNALEVLGKFSINKNLGNLIKESEEERYLFSDIALVGQSTIFYAPPNTGKTLFIIQQLMKAHQQDNLSNMYVFYINADDSRKGMIDKALILENAGIETICPGYHGFKSEDFLKMIKRLNSEGKSSQVTFVLDTVKKFTDLMDKRMTRQFGIAIGEFIAHGGTFIGLAHTNKHRSENKKLVYSGTTDLLEDVNCTYVLDPIKEEDVMGNITKTIHLYNEKMRGDNINQLTFRYTKKRGATYKEMIDTFDFISTDDFSRQEKEREAHEAHLKFMQKHFIICDIITNNLSKGSLSKSELIDIAKAGSGYGRDKCIDVIDYLTDKVITFGLGGKTNKQKIYHLIEN